MKIKDILVGISNPVSAVNSNSGNRIQHKFDTTLFKNWSSELQKQFLDKISIFEFLSAQTIEKLCDIQKNKRSDNVNNNSIYNVLPLEKSTDDKTKYIIIINYHLGFHAKHVNSRGLSKSKNNKSFIFSRRN